MTHLSWSILRIFHFRSSAKSRSTENIDFLQSARGLFVEQLPLSRYYSWVYPAYGSLELKMRRRKALKFAPARKFEHISYQNGPPASIFSKISSFQNFGVMETDAWSRITFSFRNVGSWYFGKTKFKHTDAKWLEWFPEIKPFHDREINPEIAKV